MSYQEKRSIVYLISTLLIYTLYVVYVIARAPLMSDGSPQALRFWAGAILLLVPVEIIGTVVLHVIFSVINTVATKEKEPAVTDERDQLVELKAMRNGFYLFMLAFIGAIAVLVLGQPPAVMFNLFVVGLFTSQLVGYATQFYLYRRGF